MPATDGDRPLIVQLAGTRASRVPTSCLALSPSECKQQTQSRGGGRMGAHPSGAARTRRAIPGSGPCAPACPSFRSTPRVRHGRQCGTETRPARTSSNARQTSLMADTTRSASPGMHQGPLRSDAERARRAVRRLSS
ncbi:hypothetical protein FM114_00105 [Luteococcus japonicus LSP_Lj1]|uniref:Uncharacterized protein n=1 Tax=Luteococcus japonicus LSP_Lj1 TaxID=1255658 RepID=A0A1R4I6D8_9ACTN|nr:hypothetical protein FM114_00105 [Luteococcus japonicus LSP_Lj1]